VEVPVNRHDSLKAYHEAERARAEAEKAREENEKHERTVAVATAVAKVGWQILDALLSGH
jgi:hypothetical protein